MLNRRSIRIKVLQHIYSFGHNVDLTEDVEGLKTNTLANLKSSISSIDTYYIQVIVLALNFKEIDFKNKGLKKKNQLNFNLSQNKILDLFQKKSVIKNEIISFNSSLASELELFKDWYKLLKNETFFEIYNKQDSPSVDDDIKFVKDLIFVFILKNEDINSFFESRNIHWDIDKQIIRSMLKKSIGSLNSSDFNTFAVASLSENINEDIEFASSLFECVVSNTDKYDSYVKKFVKNWDIDRISKMDLSIIRLGIAEMTSFNHIPVKVTINECIDLAKNFSSPKSGKFVNGLLDVISLNLQETGQIKKTGKGLIDNK
ncbi:MAG: transcription antitermination factor NusB [Flammeovirgaceae bacterium]|nr:transcription antitermination factor NusB [Flammeovirgaceae bacterium]|tara:strand:- start:1066 stop:2013 length:948 start_codon:yes stop_codon:yes gene_type:complete